MEHRHKPPCAPLLICVRTLFRQHMPLLRSFCLQIARPLLRVPTLCIHLQSGEERAAFKVNKEEHLRPVLALQEQTNPPKKQDLQAQLCSRWHAMRGPSAEGMARRRALEPEEKCCV